VLVALLAGDERQDGVDDVLRQGHAPPGCAGLGRSQGVAAVGLALQAPHDAKGRWQARRGHVHMALRLATRSSVSHDVATHPYV